MKPRIVVVDDDAENCRALCDWLAAENFEARFFEGGEAAWTAIENGQVRPHAIVADVRMPGLDGVALLRRVKARFPALPVILVSAFADEAIWAEGLREGAVDVFPKPIQGASLVCTLRKAVGASQVEAFRVGENPDPRPSGVANEEDGKVKKLALTILVASALLASLSPAFAEQTITSPALPEGVNPERNGFLSEIWFAEGVFAGG
jgi:DNA-binding NtrC family response regulator